MSMERVEGRQVVLWLMCGLSPLLVAGWAELMRRDVVAADTRCKVAFSTTALCSAVDASEGTLTVGGVTEEGVRV